MGISEICALSVVACRALVMIGLSPDVRLAKKALHPIIRIRTRTVWRDTFGKRVPRPRSIGTALPNKTIVARTHDFGMSLRLPNSKALLIQPKLGFQRINAL